VVACHGNTAGSSQHPGTDEDGSMNGTTTQRYGTAAVAAARALDVHVAGNELMIQGSWSIPCTAPATFHKPRPRRPQVSSS
jgi:hypothetical protein